MKERKLLLIFVGLILAVPVVYGQSSLCDLPSDAPKPESCGSGLDYNVLDSEVRDETVDQDIFVPRVEVDTNAEEVYLEIGSRENRLFNDGNHEDYSSTDDWYGNSLDISDSVGERQLRLRLEKGTESETVDLQTTEFKRTPPEPEVTAEFNDAGLLLEIDTSYPLETVVDLNVTVSNGGNTRKEEKLSLSCDENCVRQVSFTPQGGDEAEVKAQQIYNGLKGDKSTEKFQFAGEPSITTVNYSRGLESDLDEKVAVDSYWMPGTVGISAVNFKEEDIQEFNYTYNNQEIGEWDQDSGLSFNLYQELDSYAGNNIFMGPYNFSGSEIPGGLGSEAEIRLNVKLDSGETISKDLADVEAVEDNQAPVISDEPTVWHINSSSVDIYLDLKDNLQNHVDCEAYTSDGDKFIGDCSTNLRSPGGEGFGDLETDMPQNVGNIINIDVELSDGSGNSKTRTIGPFLIDGEGALKAVEKNGDPTEKMNLVVVGHQMSPSETENALEERIDWFFTQGDLDVHSDYRDFFNWYMLDTDRDVCGEVSGYDSGDTEECDILDSSSESIEQSEEIQGGRTAYIIMSSDSFRSYAGWSETYIADQYVGGDDNVFAHELGHLLWGFDDEYGYDNEIRKSSPTLFFRSSDGASLNAEKYSNTFIQEENCESNMTAYYPELSSSDCWYQDDASGGKGYIVRNNEKGKSLMYHNEPVYYQNHEKRIKYLIENSPLYQGVIN